MTARRAVVVGPAGEGGIDRMSRQIVSFQGEGGWCFERFDTVDTTVRKWQAQIRFAHRMRQFGQLLETQPDVCAMQVASRGSTLRKALLAPMCRRRKIPYVVHLHGGRYPRFYAALPAPLRRQVRRFFGLAGRVIVLGRGWGEFVTGELGVPGGRVVILPNAVPGPAVPRRRLAGEVPHILFLGRLTAEKGADLLLAALTDRRLRLRSWRATVAGGGDLRRFRARLEAAGLGKAVCVPGWVSRAGVERLLGEAHVLVQPSRVENQPLSVLEGMAHGLCVVATAVGTLPEVIRDGENGLLTPAGDARSLAATLIRAVADSGLRARLGAAARCTFERCHDVRAYPARLARILSDLLSEPQ